MESANVVACKGENIYHRSLPRRPSAPTSYPSSYIAADDSMHTSAYSSPDSSWPPGTSSCSQQPSAGPSAGIPSSKGSFGGAYPGYESPTMPELLPTSPLCILSPTQPPRADPGLGELSGKMFVYLRPSIPDSSLDKSWSPVADRQTMSIPSLSDSSHQFQGERGQEFVLNATNGRSTPSWGLPIRSLPPTGPIDNIIISLIQQQRNRMLRGDDVMSTIGPYNPSMNAIVYPDQTATTHHISTILSDLLKKTALQRIPERAAALHVMYRLVQWQIYPSKSTYDHIFDWQIPRTSQIITVHPVWADFIAWPKLRDEVISNPAAYSSEDFQHIYTSSLNVNWQWRDIDAFCIEDDGQVVLSREFERHVGNLANWSLDAPFARRYPELERLCRFTETGFGGQRYV